MKGLILAGGHGTRLRPLTYDSAKQLIPIANKPVLYYALEDLKNAGITEIIINVAPHSKDDVMRAVGDGSKFGLKVVYSLQEAPLGIAHAVKIAKDLIGAEPFVVYLGDNLLKEGIVSYAKYFEASDLDAITLVAKVKNPERFGTVEVQGKKVLRIVEKPKVPTSDLAMVGVYFLKNSVFKFLENLKPSARNELEMSDTYQNMVMDGRKVEALLIDGWWADTGTTNDIFEANRMILDDLKPQNDGEVLSGAKIEGRVRIGRGTVIRPNSNIRGPAIIGEDCDIGPDVYIGPYTSIGSKVRIQATEIENSIVMDGSRINCGMRITDSLIGKEVTIENRNNGPKGITIVVGQSSQLTIR